MVYFIPASEIIISENRQRQEFDPDALMDLANSIAARGLLHPPVLRSTPDGHVLVAGERRLRAIRDLYAMGGGFNCNGVRVPPDMVPYLTLGDLTPLEAEEAELDENLKRKDLSWQEQAAAIARLHALRVAQADARGGTHTVADTAREVFSDTTAVKTGADLGSYHAEIRTDIILAQHLDNPEVQKAKSPADAMKILKKQERAEDHRKLAERVGKTFTSSAHNLIHGNCLEVLAEVEAEYDVILADPPYGMRADSFGDGGGKLVNSEHQYDDSYESWYQLMAAFAPLSYQITKPQAHAYIFCDFDRFHELKTFMQKAGWYVFRTPLIAHKINSGRVPLPEQGPRRQYELCLYAIKGNRPVTAIYSDVISTQLTENLTHGANKPVELYVNLLKRSIQPGNKVLDPFAGSGTIFPAADQLKCEALGIEQSAEYYGIALERLDALSTEPTLL